MRLNLGGVLARGNCERIGADLGQRDRRRVLRRRRNGRDAKAKKRQAEQRDSTAAITQNSVHPDFFLCSGEITFTSCFLE
jgi:hypothetical protein